jgi:hypothetical protein
MSWENLMRLLFPVAVAISATSLAQPATAPVSPGQRHSPVAGSDCPDADRFLARRGGKWQDKPVRPQKLAELPPAETFAAVLRHDERGCMVPVMYRDVRR